jgi:hypothetical protein
VPTRPPFPEQIDNTMRTAFASCERKFWIAFVRSFTSPMISIDLHAGAAFAHGLEIARRAFFIEGKSADEAVTMGWLELHAYYGDFDSSRKPNKSAHRMGCALIMYFEEYPLETDFLRPAMKGGKPAIEYNFAIPLPIKHPETGLPIIYCGRFDMIGDTGSHLVVVDEKTTGSLGEYWATKYQLSSQFTGYVWAAQEHGYPVTSALIRGIGILKSEIRHGVLPLPKLDFMIGEWYSTLLEDINRMIASWLRTNFDMEHQWNAWRPNLGDACGAYGGCQYMDVCRTMPALRDKLLEINYVVRVWDPLRLKGTDDAT